MPAKNALKPYDVNSFYHVYNRGVNKRTIFLDKWDYEYFISLFKRYLGAEVMKDDKDRPYPNYHDDIDLMSYCLMPNHFHLMIRQNDDPKAMESFMRSLSTAYTAYFNRRHKRTGHLFQGTYKASKIDHEPYLLHISRYIHLNPQNYREWPYSSWPFFTKGWMEDWMKQHFVFELFEGGDYEKFADEYLPIKHDLDKIYKQLANK